MIAEMWAHLRLDIWDNQVEGIYDKLFNIQKKMNCSDIMYTRCNVRCCGHKDKADWKSPGLRIKSRFPSEGIVKKSRQGLPWGPVVTNPPFNAGVRVPCLVRELRSHMPGEAGTTKPACHN